MQECCFLEKFTLLAKFLSYRAPEVTNLTSDRKTESENISSKKIIAELKGMPLLR